MVLVLMINIFAKDSISVIFHPTTTFINPGRTTSKFFERDAAISMMNALELAVKKSNTHITIIHIVQPGTTELIDHASLINQINPTLTIFFSAYSISDPLPECGIYSYAWSTFIPSTSFTDIFFISEVDAYRVSQKKTYYMMTELNKLLMTSGHYWSRIIFSSFPLVTLRGITVPALLIEIGIPEEGFDYNEYGALLADAFVKIIQ